jgi:hypothetical protein
MLLRRHPLGVYASGAVGIMVIFFEIVEVLVIGSEPGVARGLQIFYSILGLIIALLAAVLWVSGRSPAPEAEAAPVRQPSH